MPASPAPWCASARTALRSDAKLPLDAVTLTAPLPKPRRIFGIAHNYRDALAERGMAPPDKPVLFMKAPRTIIGTGQPVVLPTGNRRRHL